MVQVLGGGWCRLDLRLGRRPGRGSTNWFWTLFAGFPLDYPGRQDEHGFCESYLQNADDIA